ncbi:hypothetical protein H4R33_002670, partial [Dimargaris cristalligena]
MEDQKALRESIDQFTKTCHTCQINAIATIRNTPRSTTYGDRKPGEHLYLDIGYIGQVGPDEETQFLIIADAASRFYQAIPLLQSTASDI